VRFLFQYPSVNGTDADLLDAGPVGEVARAAEAAGWDGFTFTEHPVPGAKWLARGGHQSLDPFAALAYVAGVTTRLRLVPYLAVAPYRNPFLLAKAAATIDRLSNGRFILGLGTGYLKGEFAALGVDFDERNALFDETLDALPLHWSGEPFSYTGTHFEARDAIALPRPTNGTVPVWIGGNSMLTLRRVAERAQGWMPLTSAQDISATTRTPHLATLDDLAQRIATLRELAGARADQIEICSAYNDATISNPAADISRHRDAFAALEAIGVASLVVSTADLEQPAARFVESFADAYINS
jgi:probable F420-dependent oxidoreductase